MFQVYAQQNVETLNEAGVKQDRHQLPALLQHALERVPGLRRPLRGRPPHRAARELLEEGRLEPVAGTEEITYHDSCYLARHNDVLAAPRALSPRWGGRSRWPGAASGLLLRRRRRTHVDGGARPAINEERAREAVGTGASTLAVACPFCTVMLDDGVRQVGGEMRVADVATLLAEALDDSATESEG